MNIVNKNDLIITPTRGSGPGGQHRNKNYTGIRIEHPASGAVAEATDSKSQEDNRRAAFRRMIDTPEFKVWLDMRVHPEHLLVEVFKEGKWQLEQRR